MHFSQADYILEYCTATCRSVALIRIAVERGYSLNKLFVQNVTFSPSLLEWVVRMLSYISGS